ncbi:iron uptake porin [Scytonema sp. PCC 10023]|uniref:iron uptake porin n=1 Tax=Scytonema sp. PCC 10023 TaxID=1680591 RepID=UPI0039C6718A
MSLHQNHLIIKTSVKVANYNFLGSSDRKLKKISENKILVQQVLQTFRVINPLILSIVIALGAPVKASEIAVEAEILNEQALDKMTSVSQLSDVKPTDWAFVALQSLMERYGCITKYADNTYKGYRPLTRYEFAVGLNACINTINQQLQNQLPQSLEADITTIKRLQDEFARELASLRDRVETLEANSAVLKSQQFSSTTKLSGSIVVVASGIAGDSADSNLDTRIDSNVALNHRTRLNFISSFTGKDRLLVRLQSSNRVPNFNGASATNMTRLSFEVGNNDSSVDLNLLEYRFPVAENLNIYLYGNAASHHYYATVVNPYFASFGGAQGSPSRFLERNPIYRIGFISPAGVAAVYNNKTIRLDVGYLAENSEVANQGLFGETYSALAQLSLKPAQNLEFGLTYVHNYSPDGNLLHRTGSNFANTPFGSGVPLVSNAFGVEALWRISQKIAVSSWFGYINAVRVDSVEGNADIINYAINLAFPDLFKENAVAGLGFGMPPKVIYNTIDNREDSATGLHFEAFYQYPLTENITVIPGIIYLTNANHNEANGDIFVGTVRTVFNF